MQIELNQILFQALNFGILLFVLTKFLFKPILKILDDRSDRIEKGLKAAEKSIAAQEKLEEKKAAELAAAEKKANALIAAAKAESKKMGAELLAAAKEESARVIAKQEAEFVERAHTLEKEMQSRLASLVVTTTKQALSDTLSAAEINSINAKITKSLK